MFLTSNIMYSLSLWALDFLDYTRLLIYGIRIGVVSVMI